jgi:hypothetical protein
MCESFTIWVDCISKRGYTQPKPVEDVFTQNIKIEEKEELHGTMEGSISDDPIFNIDEIRQKQK